MALLKEPFVAPLFLGVYCPKFIYHEMKMKLVSVLLLITLRIYSTLRKAHYDIL